MARNKTVKREVIVKKANEYILFVTNHPEWTKEVKDAKRQAAISFTESILMDGNTYAGFGYIRGLGLSDQWYKDGMPGLGYNDPYLIDPLAVFFY
jgi:hypothetical protein